MARVTFKGELAGSQFVSAIRGASLIPRDFKARAIELYADARAISWESARRTIERYMTTGKERRGTKKPNDVAVESIRLAAREYEESHTVVVPGDPIPEGESVFTRTNHVVFHGTLDEAIASEKQQIVTMRSTDARIAEARISPNIEPIRTSSGMILRPVENFWKIIEVIWWKSEPKRKK